jgi:GH18 family chitinase
VLISNVDMINVMTYDLYGSWYNKIGHHSALFHRSGVTGMDRELNTVCIRRRKRRNIYWNYI